MIPAPGEIGRSATRLVLERRNRMLRDLVGPTS
jgi:hypothetical protein